MKGKADLVRALIKKAESDLAIVEMCLAKEKSLDAACFHAQQAAEKYLKAYLTANGKEFPFVHNLEKLVQLCSEGDEAFLTVKDVAQGLSPYAVQARYDTDFWPSLDTARQAREATERIRRFVLSRLPPEVTINDQNDA